MSDPIVVIPARYGSRRFPGKPLVPIRGATGKAKPLLQRTWEVGIASGYRTVIATDDKRIADAAIAWGAEVFETGDYGIRNGTERCALFAAFNSLKWGDTIINLQGDALLTPPDWIRSIASTLHHDDGSETGETVATIAAPWGYEGLGGVVCYSDIMGHAYHFSRAREGVVIHPEALRHFGLYAYTVEALIEYKAFDGYAPLEANEDLEQLRWLHLARPVKVIDPETGDRLPVCEVNEEGDVARVQKELTTWGIE